MVYISEYQPTCLSQSNHLTQFSAILCHQRPIYKNLSKKVQVSKDQEKAQSEKDSHSKNQGGKKPN